LLPWIAWWLVTGADEEEAPENIEDAMRAYLETVEKVSSKNKELRCVEVG